MLPRAWGICLAIALVLAGVGVADLGDDATTADAAASGDIVLREPNQGDQARVEIVDTDADADDRLFTEMQRSWRTATLDLPTGDAIELPSLVTTVDGPTRLSSGDGDSLADVLAPNPAGILDLDLPVLLEQRQAQDPSYEYTILSLTHAEHYRILGEPSVGSSYTSASTSTLEWSGGETHDRRRFDLASLHDPAELEPCEDDLEERLMGLVAEDARDHLATCLEQAIEGSDIDRANVTYAVETQWSQHADHGSIWVAHVNTTVTKGPSKELTKHRRIVTAPTASMVLADITHATGTQDGEVIDVRQGLRVTTWSSGDEPLADATEAIPSMPTVQQVDWSEDGPAWGDLSRFPFEDAHAAITDTEDGAAFFDARDLARVTSATFSDQDSALFPTLSTRSTNGVDCEPDTSPSPPGDGGERQWDLWWTSQEEGFLTGDVTQPRSARDNPTAQELPVQRASSHWWEDERSWYDLGNASTVEGPSLAHLWQERSLVDTFADNGTYALTLSAGGGFGNDQPFRLDGGVARTWCTEHTGEDAYTYETTSVQFDEGTADGVYTIWSRTEETSEGAREPVAGSPAEGPANLADR